MHLEIPYVGVLLVFNVHVNYHELSAVNVAWELDAERNIRRRDGQKRARQSERQLKQCNKSIVIHRGRKRNRG